MSKRKTSKKGAVRRTLKKADRRTRSKQKGSERQYTGVFEGSREGYGFILSAGSEGIDADIFVPARHVKDAVSGDTVKYTLDKYNGRPEAHIVSVLSRGTSVFTGVYKYIKRREGNRLAVRHTVIADDRKLCFDTLISPAHLNGAKDGDKVLCEIRSYPDTTNQQPARGVILKTYGCAEELFPNVEAALDSAGYSAGFPEAASDLADSVSKRRVISRGRLDLRDKRIFTIDGAASKDMDDAISVERTEDGFILGVHIADVSEYVAHGSALDDEAYRRGTSVYFADRVIPMLPVSLSNGACSLNPGVNRYTLSAFMDIKNDGEIKGCKVYESVIRSKVRGVYAEVNDIIEKRLDSKYYKKYSSVFGDGGLEDITDLYETLLKKSRKRHALDLDSFEFIFETDKEGTVTDARPAERGTGEKIIEQFMLAANEGVASLLKDASMPCVYRVHGSPDAEKLKNLSDFASVCGIDPAPLKKDGVDLYSIEKFLNSAKEKGKGAIFSYLILRCMMKAKYSPDFSSHFGLGAPCYCHFTSPIRRYPDLVVHRIIKTLLLGKDPGRYGLLSSYCVSAAEQSNVCEDKAAKFERDMDDLYMAAYTKRLTGEKTYAVITSVTSSGFYARLPFGAEGFVRISSVGAEYLPSLYTVVSSDKTYRAGDTVKVVISEVSVSGRRIDLDLIKE